MRPNPEGIQIVRLTTALDVDVESLRAELTSVAPDVRLEAQEPGVHALAEWFLPAALIVNVGAPFLKGFMEKLGSAAAEPLAKILTALFETVKARARKWRGSPGVEKPVTPIKLAFTLPGGAEVEFVCPSDLDKDQMEQALRELPTGMAQAQERDKARTELLRSVHEIAASGDMDQAMEMLTSEESVELRRQDLIYVYRPAESAWLDAYELLQQEAERQLGLR
ncbi:MAG: hypothetical protein ACRD4O_02030 [Bryobacteraceae bacterium]